MDEKNDMDVNMTIIFVRKSFEDQVSWTSSNKKNGLWRTPT